MSLRSRFWDWTYAPYDFSRYYEDRPDSLEAFMFPPPTINRRLSPYRQAVDAFLFEHAPRAFGGSALDIGGGRQRGAWRRDSRHYDWSVLDVEGDAAPDEEFCRQNVLDGLPWEGQTFALVTAIDVLYMIPVDRLQGVFASVARVLEPGGTFLAALPFVRPASEETDCARYTARELRRLLTSVGFETAAVWPLGGWWTCALHLTFDRGGRVTRRVSALLAGMARWRDARVATPWTVGYGIVAQRR